MKIISIKSGFAADHSSTSYEFLAVDKPLNKNDRAVVSLLSRRANPTSRRVSFIYHVDGYDIPGGWEKLMEKYYDVMYCEDYGWWTLAVAFETSEEQIEELLKYELINDEAPGVEIIPKGKRVIVAINSRLDESYIISDDYYEDDEEVEENEQVFVAENQLLNLLIQIRDQLKNGDYRVLYAVWEKCGLLEEEYEDEESDVPPAPVEKIEGKRIVEQFSDMLERPD